MDGCYDTNTLELKPGSQCHFPPGLAELHNNQASYDTPINQIDLRDPIVTNYKVTALIARDIADRVCFLDAGVICEEGPPEEIFGEPQNERTRTFLKRIIEAGRL